jgi:signal transduction histidine kinase
MLDPQPLEPSALLEPDLAGYRKSAEDKGLEFEWRPSSKPCRVNADAKRVRQVVANLVSNAIKFTDRGTVTLAIQPAGDRIRIMVEDTGIGIASGEHDSIFEPFRQGRPSGAQRDGTGLGLAIARRLVVAMGGEIGLASSPERGSRFWFTLPAAVQEVPTCTSF